MRIHELKFRAWDEGNKVMHYDFEFIRSGIEGNDWIVFKSDKQKLDDKQVIFHPLENPYFSQQLKIMQFTGLKDKDNREIYEGDMLTGRGNPILVEYSSPEFQFCYRNPDKNSWLTYPICGWGDIYEPKIIGNIYENLELLNDHLKERKDNGKI